MQERDAGESRVALFVVMASSDLALSDLALSDFRVMPEVTSDIYRPFMAVA